MFKKILFIVIILNLIISNSLSNSKVNIAVTVDEKIITNYDINNEVLYLKILNPKLNNLDEQKIINLSKESLIREIIKKNEIEKVFDLKKENPFVNQYLEDLYTKLNFNNENEFNDYILNRSNYTIAMIKEKLKIEMAWNELIYLKYSKQLKIDREKLTKKIDKLSDKTIKEYRLSEIVFNKKKDETLESLSNRIDSSILEIGFNNTANIFSISESSKFGGDIGWINENNLSELLYNELQEISEGQITKTVKIGNNFIILKIEEIRENKISIDKDKELEKMIKFETNKQLNQFSKIFFDKSKINYLINEK